jgi:hypothetical protein
VLRPVKVREPNVKGLLHRNPLNLAACEGVKGIVQTNYIGDLVTVPIVSLVYKGFYSKPFTPSPVAKIKGLYLIEPFTFPSQGLHMPRWGGDDVVVDESSERRREPNQYVYKNCFALTLHTFTGHPDQRLTLEFG